MKHNDDISTPDFYILPTALVFDDRLRPTDRILYGVIYWYASMSKRTCIASNAALSRAMNVSPTSSVVGCGLTRLEDAGYITRSFAGNGKRNRSEIKPKITFSIPQMRDRDTSNEGTSIPQMRDRDTSNEVQSYKRNYKKRTIKENTIFPSEKSLIEDTPVDKNVHIENLERTEARETRETSTTEGALVNLVIAEAAKLFPKAPVNYGHRGMRKAIESTLKLRSVDDYIEAIRKIGRHAGETYFPSLGANVQDFLMYKLPGCEAATGRERTGLDKMLHPRKNVDDTPKTQEERDLIELIKINIKRKREGLPTYKYLKDAHDDQQRQQDIPPENGGGAV